MKKKSSFNTMLKLFDTAWAENRSSPWDALIQWRTILNEHRWTDDKFDYELDTHLKLNSLTNKNKKDITKAA